MTGSSFLPACYSWNHSTVQTNLFRPSYNLPNTSGYNSDATVGTGAVLNKSLFNLIYDALAFRIELQTAADMKAYLENACYYVHLR